MMKMNNRYTEALKVISNSIKCLYAATAAEGIDVYSIDVYPLFRSKLSPLSLRALFY